MFKRIMLISTCLLLIGGCDAIEGLIYDAIIPDIDILDIVLTVVSAILYAV